MGAVLDVVGVPVDAALIAAWRTRVDRARAHLGWVECTAVARPHFGGVLLAIAAPNDQLLLATEINEWALCAALIERAPSRWSGLQQALAAAAANSEEDAIPAAGGAAVIEEKAALARFRSLADAESLPDMRALLDGAARRGLDFLIDDSKLTLGAGVGSRTFSLTALPQPTDVPWDELSNIPTVLVTGSNGKTTTVRLLAACARAHGWQAGFNCTDGVFIGDTTLATGDYSGPAGARMIMRDARTQVAILETARGGILRRGIAVSRADAAVVTNISSDHFGEYGIDDLGGLADVKLSVAAAVSAKGLLVLNADDSLLRTKAAELGRRFGSCPPLGWFSPDADQVYLQEYRRRGAPTCGARHGTLWLHHSGVDHALGNITDMPLTIGGMADYNIANLAGAALAAAALGVSATTIAAVFARFGNNPQDNPGRLMRFEYKGARILIDYAHNPDGLRGLLTVAKQLRGRSGRLGMLLGTAGNRRDSDIEELARVAGEFHPELIVVKEDEAHLRGRAPGEIPKIIRAELLRLGFAASVLPVTDTEFAAARIALEWARPGDVLALPVHSASARADVLNLLQGS
ncbi:MAG TPA: Mur ligase family protein [Steroidobacteraceae bacterium]|jgi:UDP-N-acetylmuramyl tripeptide synthase